MKKHFLLLLMAFFSLAGWAQQADLENADVSFSKVEYGGVAPIMQVIYQGQVLTENEQYTWDGKYYTSELCTAESATEDLIPRELPYWVKIEGKEGTVYGGTSTTGYFFVTKKKVIITAIAGQDGYTFGDEINTEIAFDAITFDGLLEGDGEEELVDPEVESLTFTWDEHSDAGEWAITGINGLLSDNYEFVYEDEEGEPTVNVVISPMELDGENFTVTAPEDVVYEGKNLNPAFSVVYKAGTEDEIVLEKDVDFTVANAVGEGEGEEFVPNPIYNAGAYVINITGIGNYTGELVNDELEVGQAPLQVYVNSLSKEYDGTTVIYGGTTEEPVAATIAYSGLVGADAKIANPFGANAYSAGYATPLEEDGNKNVTATGYALIPVLSAEEGAVNEVYDNYDVTLLTTGKLIVTPKAIAIKPADGLTKEIDSEDEFTAADIDVSEAIEGDQETLANGYKIVRSNTDEAVDTYEGVLSLAERTDLDEDAAAAFAAVKANYTIDATGTADFEITGGTLYVYPKSVAIVYGQSTPTTFEVVATTAGGTEVEIDKPNVIFKDLDAAPTAAGTYVLTLDAEPTVEGYEVVTLDGQYTISPKPLTVTVQSQILQVGDDEDELVPTKVDFAGKLEGDNIGYTLKFNNEEFGEGELDEAGALTEAADHKTYAAGIIIERVESTDEAPNDNDNYTIDWTITGELVVGGEFYLSFESSEEDWDDIVKYDGESANVEWAPNRNQPLAKFDGDWKANEWNTGILPFAVTPRELSNAFGYAIVNVADPDNTTETNVAFKLNMVDVIPANTPFAIKTDAAKLDIENNPLPEIPEAFESEDAEAEFWLAYNAAKADIYALFGKEGGFTIEKPESQIVEKEVAFGHKFVGVYEEVEMNNTKSNCHFMVNGAWKHLGASSTRTFTILPFNCYIESPAAAAARGLTFTFEELDGSTTAIKAISAETSGAEANAKGWYTIGGMKLQGTPAQKGVYINNGKKVIIK
jgi:hypothetical protein